jgi:hypothetical protein
MEITKDTFLKAEDPRNRDAMLYDMLNTISGQIVEYKTLLRNARKILSQLRQQVLWCRLFSLP